MKHDFLRMVGLEDDVLETFVTIRRGKNAAFGFISKPLKRHSQPETTVTDRLASNGVALKALRAIDNRDVGLWLNNRVESALRAHSVLIIDAEGSSG